MGCEALARWNHPRGLVLPSGFIAAAEESGMIIPIGAHVLDTACRQLGLWRASVLGDDVPFKMAVNISPSQLETPDLINQLRRLLAETRIPPSWLYLEITETAAIADLERTATKVAEVRDLGVRIALDDFGIGHSTLQQLHRLAIDVVKIDRSFVASLGHHDQGRHMAAAVIALSRTLGLHTVAEGVETPAQAERLRELGADLAQGYLFGSPQPAGALAQLLVPSPPIPTLDLRRAAFPCI